MTSGFPISTGRLASSLNHERRRRRSKDDTDIGVVATPEPSSPVREKAYGRPRMPAPTKERKVFTKARAVEELEFGERRVRAS